MLFTRHFDSLSDHTNLGDERLNKRYSCLCKHLSQDLSGSIPSNHADRSQTKGAYRFLSNKKVNPDGLIEGHRETYMAEEAAKDRPFYLMLQDTTGIVLTGKKGAAQLGPLNYKGNRGFYLHSSLLVSGCGVPIGLFKQSFVERTQESLGGAEQRRRLPIEEKETYRWLAHFRASQAYFKDRSETTVLEVADREADFYELLTAYDAKEAPNVHFLIRSKHNRRIAGTKKETLNTLLAASPVKGRSQVEVTDRKTAKKRKAQLEIQFESVKLQLHLPQGDKKQLPPIRLWVIQARELNPPSTKKAVAWRLLTSFPVDNLSTAKLMIHYYTLRWLIERFYYILKQGAQVEQLQLSTAKRLKNAVSLFSVVAVNMMRLNYWARNHPTSSIFQLGFSELQYKALYMYLNQFVNKNIQFNPRDPPDIAEFVERIAQLGGFIKAKSKPFPGLKTFWKGIKKFQIITQVYSLKKDA